MSSFFLAVLAFGVGGIDPLGALIVGGALAGGARRTAAVAFTVTAAVVTVAVGGTASWLLGPLVGQVDLRFSWVSDTTWLVVNLVLLAALLPWGIRRLLRKAPLRKTRRLTQTRSTSTGALVLAGALFGISALTDPTYYAVIALAGRNEPVWLTYTGVAMWFLISQCPLLTVTLAAVLGVHQGLVRRAHRLWQRVKPTAAKVLTVAIFVSVAVLVADTTSYLLYEHFLIG